MKKCGFAAIGISVAAFIAPTHPASAENLQIVWRVVDQFRLLQNDVDVSSVLQQIRTAPSRAAGGRTDSFPSPLALRSYDLNTPAIPSTRWDAVTQQYHARYAHPSTWENQVSVRGAQASTVCNWSTTETVEPKSGSCTNVRLPVKLLDEVRVSIVATPRNDSIVLSLPTKIEHRRIVVMGDSFASGEGVPEINRQPPDSDSNSRETTGDPYTEITRFAAVSMTSSGDWASTPWSAVRYLRTGLVTGFRTRMIRFFFFRSTSNASASKPGAQMISKKIVSIASAVVLSIRAEVMSTPPKALTGSPANAASHASFTLGRTAAPQALLCFSIANGTPPRVDRSSISSAILSLIPVDMKSYSMARHCM